MTFLHAVQQVLSKRQISFQLPALNTLCSACQVLDPADEATLWSSPYGETTAQWITFDLGSDCPVGALRLLAMSNTTCPKLVMPLLRVTSSFDSKL